MSALAEIGYVRGLATDACCSLHAPAPLVECRPLPTSPVFPNAFNSLSMQYVSRTPLPIQGDRFWDIPPFMERNRDRAQ